METKIVFKNAGEPWSVQEDTQLNKLYNEDKLDIMKISQIHDRAPGGIISRLIKNNCIQNRILARGYMTYKNSELYKEIVANNEEKKRKKSETSTSDVKDKKSKHKEVDNILITINKCDYVELKQDVIEMKNEITELKKSIKELVKIMKAVSAFE
jgi:hypothetical protein